jgi:hypothetical protein
MNHLYDYIMKEDHFNSMKSFHHSYSDMSYQEFMSWNIQCVNQLSDEESTWLDGLCKLLKSARLDIHELNTCSKIEAQCFYFDDNKKLVIANPS